MTGTQWTVLTLLLLTGGVEILFSPVSSLLLIKAVSGQIQQPAINTNQAISEQLAAPAIGLIGFVLGIFLLLWLASGVPKLAVTIAWAILIVTILRYGSDIGALVNATPTAKKGSTK